jgi:hypothetical protein
LAGCKGKTLKIMQGVRHGSVDVFPAHCPSKEIVL